MPTRIFERFGIDGTARQVILVAHPLTADAAMLTTVLPLTFKIHVSLYN